MTTYQRQTTAREVIIYFSWLFLATAASVALLFPAAFMVFHTKRVPPEAAALVFWPAIILATYWRLKRTGKHFYDIGLRFETRFSILLLAGIAVGAAFMILVFGVLSASKLVTVRVQVLDSSLAVALVIGAFTTFVQSGTEEVVFRGYLLKVLSAKSSSFGIFVTAALFSILHFPQGINMLGWLNIFLFGVLAAELLHVSKTLWVPIGFHFGWNLFQDQVFGFPVYGQNNLGFLQSAPLGRTLLNGGSYGPEASLVITAALLLALFAIYRLVNEEKNEGPAQQAVRADFENAPFG